MYATTKAFSDTTTDEQPLRGHLANGVCASSCEQRTDAPARFVNEHERTVHERGPFMNEVLGTTDFGERT